MIVYKEDASSLKKTRMLQDILSDITGIVVELLVLLVLFKILGNIAIVPYFFAQLIFLPYPIVKTPREYSITEKGLLLDNKTMIPSHRIKKTQVIHKINMVSLKDRFNKEFIRLYTADPEKLASVINSTLIENKTHSKS